MIVREYSLELIKISSYVTFLASKRKDEMRTFLIGIPGDMEVECQSAMIHDNIDLFRLIVHVQQV